MDGPQDTKHPQLAQQPTTTSSEHETVLNCLHCFVVSCEAGI